MALRTTLNQLASALQQKYPSKLAELAPPSTKKDLRLLEKRYGRAIPDDVVELYGWRGGGEGFLVQKGDDEESEGWDWSQPARVGGDLSIWRKLRSDFPKTWLPLFSNGAGDNVCVDSETGALFAVLHETPDERPKVAKSLEDALGYVLKRVKEGTWRGSPESGQVKALLTKLRKRDADWFGIFGNSLFTMTQKDPAGALTVLAGAQKIVEDARDIAPDERKSLYHSRLAKIFETRTLALLAKKDAEAAWAEYQRWISMVMEAGTLERPILIAAGFEKLRQKGRAEEVQELIAMDETYLLYQWLTARLEKGPAKAKSLRELLSSAEDLLPEAGKDESARMQAIKGRVLAELGKSIESKKAWAAASKANAKIAAFWKTHPLLG